MDSIRTLTARVNEEGLIGFRPNLALLERQRVQYTFPESVTSGVKEAFQVTIFNIRGLGKIIRGEVGRKSVKSVIGIAEYFGGTWDWRKVSGFSPECFQCGLAFLNFLPIPALGWWSCDVPKL